MSRVVAFLDGPPGAGKSTVLSQLAAKYKITVIQEPLVQWSAALSELERLEQSIQVIVANTDDVSHHLMSMYAKYELAFVHFQTLVLSWYQQLADRIPRIQPQKGQSNIVVIERSPMSAKVFHRLACMTDDRTNECVEQLELIGAQLPAIEATYFFNLVLPTETALERLQQRKAPGDARWTMETLNAYYDLFNAVMNEAEVEPINIDATQSPEDMSTEIFKKIKVKGSHRRSRFDMFF